MKAQDQYLKFVKWEETDALYVGYCPDLFPWGGVCHAETEADAYKNFALWWKKKSWNWSQRENRFHRPARDPCVRRSLPNQTWESV